MHSTGNICSCGDGGSKRGHPKRCDVQVHCIEDKGIMYPLGVLCGTNQCRNSLDGTCSSDCSSEVCNQPVPSGRYFMVLTRLFDILLWCQYQNLEKCEETKGVIRNRKSKDRHYNNQKKRDK